MATATLGSAVTFTATVVPVQATGKITFYAGTTILGTRTISGGEALLTTSMLPAGTFPVRAHYSGDAGDGVAMSAPLTQSVHARVRALA